jgi:hypothetical protein
MQDVMDHMEKRVKSRFSHRRILIKPPTEFEPRKPKQARQWNVETPVLHVETVDESTWERIL